MLARSQVTAQGEEEEEPAGPDARPVAAAAPVAAAPTAAAARGGIGRAHRWTCGQRAWEGPHSAAIAHRSAPFSAMYVEKSLGRFLDPVERFRAWRWLVALCLWPQ